MKNKMIFAVAAGVVLVAGCGSKQDANEKNFGAAISQYLDKKGELCLGLGKWPVDVVMSKFDLIIRKDNPTSTAKQMEALVAIGLASVTNVEVEEKPMFGNKLIKSNVNRYVLTDAGKKFYREGKEDAAIGFDGSKENNICYGKKALDKVVKWEGPMKFGDYQEASVKYLYKINDLADWTKKPEFLAAFPNVGKIVEAAGKKEQLHGVKLTNQGWEARGL